jgi:hypothetical protein
LAIWPGRKAKDTEIGWLSNRASRVVSFAREGRALLRDCQVDELIQSYTLCRGQTRAERQMINQKWL